MEIAYPQADVGFLRCRFSRDKRNLVIIESFTITIVIFSCNVRMYVFAGGNGYINDYPVGRYLRDAKLYEIGAGTSEVRRMVIARSITEEYS